MTRKNCCKQSYLGNLENCARRYRLRLILFCSSIVLTTKWLHITVIGRRKGMRNNVLRTNFYSGKWLEETWRHHTNGISKHRTGQASLHKESALSIHIAALLLSTTPYKQLGPQEVHYFLLKAIVFLNSTILCLRNSCKTFHERILSCPCGHIRH